MLVAWLARLPEQSRGILKTVLFGTAAGFIAVAFHLAIHASHTAGLVRLATLDLPTFLWSSFLLVMGTSLLSGWLLNTFCAEAAGSGVPQLKAAFWKNFGFVPFRVVWVKFLAAALQIGGGQ
jgi:CIC family chloride channel protein